MSTEPTNKPAAEQDTSRQLLNRVLPALVFTLVYFSFFVYPPLQVGWLLDPHWRPGTGILLAIMTGPALCRLAYEVVPHRLTRGLSAMGLTWAGFSFIAFMVLMPYQLCALLAPNVAAITTPYVIGAIAALCFLALANAQQLQVLTVPITGAKQLRGHNLVQISDVHIGSRSPRFLRRVVRKVNTLPADYVLITGDLIDFSDIDAAQLAPLGQLNAPAIFCIGNHERYVDLEAICDRLESVGVTVLRNRSVDLEPFQFIGIDDAERRDQINREIIKLTPIPERFRILLYHRPDAAEAAAQWGVDLMLCGHTHNGQILPFNFLVKRVFPRICGHYTVAAMQLYVSRGTGTWGPILRLGSTGEITHLRLV